MLTSTDKTASTIGTLQTGTLLGPKEMNYYLMIVLRFM